MSAKVKKLLNSFKMYTKIISALIFALCLGAVTAGNLADTVRECGPNVPTPDELFVDGCDNNPCEVRNGTTVYFELVVTPGN